MPVAPRTRPSFGRMVLRGMFRRCAWCSDRKAFFTGWFERRERCRGCGISWRRGDVGYELGAATINTIVTFGLLVIGTAVSVIATSPDIPVLPIVAGLVVAAIVIPIAIYPMTYTVWQAIDLAMRPPGPADFPAVASDGAP